MGVKLFITWFALMFTIIVTGMMTVDNDRLQEITHRAFAVLGLLGVIGVIVAVWVAA